MSLRVASWNPGGLARRTRNKDFLRLARDFDIITIQESLLHKASRRPSVPGFEIFHRDGVLPPRGRPVGGLSVLVSFAVLSKFRVDIEPVDECGVECLLLRFSRLSVGQSDFPASFLLFNVYVPPHPAVPNYEKLSEAVLDVLETRSDLCPVLFTGDFNCHAISRRSSFQAFYELFCEEGFRVFPELGSSIPTFVSHKGASVIDFCFARGFEWDRNGGSLFPLDDFGHRVVQLHFSFPRLSGFLLAPRTSFRRHVRELPPANYFQEFVGRHELKSPVDVLRKGVSVVFSLFLCWFLPFLFEVRPPEGEEEVWTRYLSFAELKELRSAKARVKCCSDRVRIGSCLDDLRKASRDLGALRTSLRSLAHSRFTEATHSAGDDPSLLWKTVRNFRLDPVAAQGLPVDTLCAHFCSLFNRSSDVVSLPFVYDFVPKDGELDARFRLCELDRVFAELRAGVAPGPSGVGNDVILEFDKVPGMRVFLLDLFNGCLIGGSIPDAWGRCEMFLLYKGKGDPLLPGSYRAIALLDCFLKVYERLLFHRLDAWARRLELIPPAQFGFRPRSGTLDAVFVLSKLVNRFVLRGQGLMFAALIDFKSAFPSVDRTILFQKLAALGISSRFGRALHSLFEKNTFVLRFQSGVTEDFCVNSGLREGSVLSPLLFSIFISDMERSVLRPFNSAANFQFRDFSVAGVLFPGLLYADDLVILARSRLCLRERLKRLSAYVAANKLTVNVGKCEVVVFGGRHSDFSFRFCGEPIPVRARCKYLGVLFGESEGIDLHLQSLASRFASSTSVFFQLMRRLQVSNLTLLGRLKSSLLLSTLYGIEFGKDVRLAEALGVHFRRGLRSFLGVPSRVSNDFLSMLFPGFSFEGFLVKRKVGFLRRMLGPSDTLAAVLFLEDRVVDFPRKLGFSAELLTLLTSLGIPDLVYACEKGDVARVLGHESEKEGLLAWERMRVATSTAFLCTVFSSPKELFHCLLAVSSINLNALRIFLLMWSGSVGLQVLGTHERVCRFCSQSLSTKHYFGCDFDTCRHLQLIVAARNGKFGDVIRYTMQAYFAFYFRSRPCILSEEELFLAEAGETEFEKLFSC